MEYNMIEFIRKSYVITKHNDLITIRDVFEQNPVNTIDITSKVSFQWGKAQVITGVNLYSKEYIHTQKIIKEVFRDKQSMNFYTFLINESENITIPLKDIKFEFPKLYGEQVRRIISENITKD
tara:strand:- start:6 stop:374 length:369 start_codon:yes stop_codon:yes gene_type:complete